ncbi:MAG TPA: methionine gamma-lyase family protein [Candidatus Baltobacteraceae bacterium]|nr:methionine gamma-lyase family protein [Candidatus Baltobacteraceae bacterium]
MIEALLERFPVSPEVARAARVAADRFREPDPATRARIATHVLGAFYDEGLSESDLNATFGYGYDDAGRERYEALLARVLRAERALARISFASGTATIVATLAACLPHAGRLIAATGPPYDTLRHALLEAPYSLVARGIDYREVALTARGAVDLEALRAEVARGADVVFVQRSRGYAPRPSLSAAACGEVARCVKAIAPYALVLVDNCYGELVEETEPTAHGADAVMGSLIKNLGGGLAPAGGYVAGSAGVIERVAAYHYAPGLGTAVGPTFGLTRALAHGLFLAPGVVSEALNGLDFAAALFVELGYQVDPQPGAARYDVVQAIRLGDARRLLAFARGLQRAMPVNARFVPEAGAVPGYPEPVVMAGGAFVAGATIELSCDAPLREPFEIYLQGGSSRAHALMGAVFAADAVVKESK